MIQIPAIYADIRLREYSPDMEDLTVRVWLNPTLEVVRERIAIQRDTLSVMSNSDIKTEERIEQLEGFRPRQFAWLAKVLGSGPDSEARYMPSAEDLTEAYQVSPDFIQWLTAKVSDAIDAHREREKKTLPTR